MRVAQLTNQLLNNQRVNYKLTDANSISNQQVDTTKLALTIDATGKVVKSPKLDLSSPFTQRNLKMDKTQRMDKQLSFNQLHMNNVSNQFKEMIETADASVFKTSMGSSNCFANKTRNGLPHLTINHTDGKNEPGPSRGASPSSIASSTWTRQYHGSGILYPKDKDKDLFTSAFKSK